jgi:hypothetical protein
MAASERSRPAIIRVSFPLPGTHSGAGGLHTHAREIEKGKKGKKSNRAGVHGPRVATAW